MRTMAQPNLPDRPLKRTKKVKSSTKKKDDHFIILVCLVGANLKNLPQIDIKMAKTTVNSLSKT